MLKQLANGCFDTKYKEFCDREAGQFGLPRYMIGVVGTNVGAKRYSKKDSCYVPAKELLKKQQLK